MATKNAANRSITDTSPVAVVNNTTITQNDAVGTIIPISTNKVRAIMLEWTLTFSRTIQLAFGISSSQDILQIAPEKSIAVGEYTSGRT